MVKWIVFYHGDRELVAITLNGLFYGEIQTTKEELAYEHGIPKHEISVILQDRPLRRSTT